MRTLEQFMQSDYGFQIFASKDDINTSLYKLVEVNESDRFIVFKSRINAVIIPFEQLHTRVFIKPNNLQVEWNNIVNELHATTSSQAIQYNLEKEHEFPMVGMSKVYAIDKCNENQIIFIVNTKDTFSKTVIPKQTGIFSAIYSTVIELLKAGEVAEKQAELVVFNNDTIEKVLALNGVDTYDNVDKEELLVINQELKDFIKTNEFIYSSF